MPRHLQWSALGLALLIQGGCASQSYDEAVRRSAVFEPAHVQDLVTIPPSETSVKVVSWTSRQTADKYYPLGKGQVGVDVWVTRVPQVSQRCAAFPAGSDALRQRLQQLLGLPAQAEDRIFVEMEVARADLFRPCPDPDPAKSSCGGDFPAGVSDSHKVWMAEQFLSRYRNPGGYPWTHLGYTYDWGGESIVGAAEFVLRKGAAMTVTQKVETPAYCGK